MADIDDLFEAVFDIEDIIEEVIEPEDLLENLVENPLAVIAALVAGAAAVFTGLLLLITLILAVFAFGFFRVAAVLTALSFMTMLLGVGGFLYFRTDLPDHVQQRVNDALEEADDTPHGQNAMSEQEAIEQLKTQYANNEISDTELDEGIDRVLRSDDPEEALRSLQYTTN